VCRDHDAVDLGFTEQRFAAGTHICLIYDDDQERRALMSDFVRSGLACAEQVMYLTDAAPGSVRAWLAERGVPVPADEADPGLMVKPTVDVYCREGRFTPEAMFDVWRAYYHNAGEAGYAGARATGETSWALDGHPGAERLLEYEALLTDVLRRTPVTAVCQYDANRFDGGTILDILRVHPLLVVRGQVVQNPYYLAPEDFLRDHVVR